MYPGATDSKTSTPLLGAAQPSLPPYATQIGTAQEPFPVYVKRRESLVRRRLLVLVLFGLAVLAGFCGQKLYRWHATGGHNFYRTDEYPSPPGVTLTDCSLAEWSETETADPHSSLPYSDSVSLDVSLAPETLLFFSQGALSAGKLKVTTSPEISDIARLDIAVHYYHQYLRDKVKICFVERNDGESGVGIFTPEHWQRRRGHYDRLSFDVVLTLPHGTSSLYLNRLETHITNFSHDLDHLKDIIDFGEILLKGSNGRITAKAISANSAYFTTSNGAVFADYLVAQSASVHTSNARISGTYEAVDSLNLRTTNGAVNVHAILNGSETTEANKVTIRTSNSPLESTIDLGAPSSSGGSFVVETVTSNSRVATHIASSPLDSVLTVDARTSNSRAEVALPVTYEGDVELYTSNSAVNILPSNSKKEDPAGKGRKRSVETRVVTKGRAAKGSVYWDRENMHRGKVVLRTSNGPATISV